MRRFLPQSPISLIALISAIATPAFAQPPAATDSASANSGERREYRRHHRHRNTPRQPAIKRADRGFGGQRPISPEQRRKRHSPA